MRWSFQALANDVWIIGCRETPDTSTPNCPSPEESVLLREQEIQRLKVENDALLEGIAALQRNLAAARSELEKAEEDQHAAQQELSEHQEQLTAVQSGLA